MRESLYHETKHVVGMASASIASNTTTHAGAAVDLAQSPGDWRSVLWLVVGGTITDGTYTLKVMDSPDNTTFTDVTDTSMVQGPSSTITATGGSAEIAYTGNKRYARLSIVSTAVTTGGAISARAILHGSAMARR